MASHLANILYVSPCVHLSAQRNNNPLTISPLAVQNKIVSIALSTWRLVPADTVTDVQGEFILSIVYCQLIWGQLLTKNNTSDLTENTSSLNSHKPSSFPTSTITLAIHPKVKICLQKNSKRILIGFMKISSCESGSFYTSRIHGKKVVIAKLKKKKN